MRDEEPSPKMGRKQTWVLVYRRNYSVWRWELSQPAHDLLQALSCGTPLGEAIFAITEKHSGRSKNWNKQLFKWFSDWVSDGIFQKIEL